MKSTGTARLLTVGEIARQFGLATHVLRHWESVGLLSPERSASGHRLYAEADQYRVAVILLAKDAGLGLDDIHEMTRGAAQDRTAMLLRKQRELQEKVAVAQACLSLVECALDCDHDDIAACGYFQDAVRERIKD